MITKSDVLKIIDYREKNLDKWLEQNPEKISILKLKKYLIEKWNDIEKAKKFSKDNDSIIPTSEYGFVYTLMNEYSSYRGYTIVSLFYIHKLEKELKSHRKN